MGEQLGLGMVNKSFDRMFKPKRKAWWSDCGHYRYRLEEIWEPNLPLLNFVLLNPSTAGRPDPANPGELTSDQTFTRACVRARRWKEFATKPPHDIGGVIFTNAYAWTETNSLEVKKLLKAGKDLIGPDNDASIVKAAQDVRASHGLVICAWGAHCSPARSKDVLRLLMATAKVTPQALRFTASGAPVHILYLPYDLGGGPYAITEPNFCRGCGFEIAADSLACGECSCEDDCTP
ncbi:MAG: DUF1643 domain-containing protein [Betaproteobacteria bacterium]|nr:DUF1643 domain-containing protein [Betaproteobacteria bacterium]MDH4322868.1 DUF1643 domain-containing protein [Betaproteobacteria bacterium]MDH5210544.1 DUF1643 domain-containing protein [Betaproteobacteria bacterium]